MCEPSVALVAPNFRPRYGGIESFVDGLARWAWPESTTVIAPPVAGADSWDAAAPYRVERQPLVGPVPPRWIRSRPLVHRLSQKADVLVCAEWWPAARVPPPRRARALRTLMVHGTEIVAAEGRGRASMRRAVRSVDLVLANSRYTASQLAERVSGCPPIEVLHPGADTEPERADPADVKARLGLGDGPVVLTAARLVARKGHVEFAAHWPAVTSEVPGAQWVVAGAGPQAEALRRVAGPSVRMVGAVDPPTLMALYRMADVHLLPGLPSAQVEGFGMAVVEAGAAGTPSVAADLGGVAEALGGAGLLVPGGDMAATAEAVAGLLRDDELRERLGRQARARAEQLRWDLVGARFRQLIGERLA